MGTRRFRNIIMHLSCWVALSLLLTGCTGDNVPDCFQGSGELIRERIAVPEFSKITVFERNRVVLISGNQHLVEVETGKSLRNEVSATVEGDRLILRNENACNFFREYGITTFYITAPNITEIRSSTGFPITCEGALTWDDLTLLSEAFNEPDAETTDGSFDLELASEQLKIVVNGIAYFRLEGAVDRLNVFVAARDSRIEAQELSAQNISINHRGSNDVLINPQLSLTGVIRGTGDVISFNRPDSVDVVELFKGKLIFTD